LVAEAWIAIRYSLDAGVGVGRSRTLRSLGPCELLGRLNGSGELVSVVYFDVFFDLDALHVEVCVEVMVIAIMSNV